MKTSIFLLSFFALSSFSFAAKLELDGHPESVVVDEKAGDMYVSVVGKELKPTEKDKDGYILKKGNKEGSKFEKLALFALKSSDPVAYGNKEGTKLAIPKDAFLHAPKGLTLHDGVLYATDIDRVVMIDPKSGQLLGEVDLSPEKAVFLNDTVWLNGKLYVSATDLNSIYVVDPQTKKYEKLLLKDKITAPNGLAVKAGEGDSLYMCEYAADGDKPSGRLVKINVKTGVVDVLSELRGMFDGLAWHKGSLFFSDWSMDSGAGAVRKLTGKTVSNVSKNQMKGAADFYLMGDDQLVVPAMVDKIIWTESAQ